MTVLVGLKTNSGEPAVVVGADKAQAQNHRELLHLVDYIALGGDRNIQRVLDFLKGEGMDKVGFTLDRKIEISEDKRAVLAHTGCNNDAHIKAKTLLLDPRSFLQDTDFLEQLLFPLPVSGRISGAAIGEYRAKFDLKAILTKGYSPEIRRIFDLQAVQRHELTLPDFRVAYYDRNYNPRLSEYLLATVLQGEKGNPFLFDVFITGAIVPRFYSTNGGGGLLASKYVRQQLETRENIFGGETATKKRIETTDAIEIVRGAVQYANRHYPFCKGFDYVVLTPKGVEPHFSDEKAEFSISLDQLIKRRLRIIEQERRALQKIQSIK